MSLKNSPNSRKNQILQRNLCAQVAELPKLRKSFRSTDSLCWKKAKQFNMSLAQLNLKNLALLRMSDFLWVWLEFGQFYKMFAKLSKYLRFQDLFGCNEGLGVLYGCLITLPIWCSREHPVDLLPAILRKHAGTHEDLSNPQLAKAKNMRGCIEHPTN